MLAGAHQGSYKSAQCQLCTVCLIYRRLLCKHKVQKCEVKNQLGQFNGLSSPSYNYIFFKHFSHIDIL